MLELKKLQLTRVIFQNLALIVCHKDFLNSFTIQKSRVPG